MLRSEDVADKTFTTTRLREGYEIAEVDCFRTDVVEAITVRDRVISELQAELSAARSRPEGARPDEMPADPGAGEETRREGSAAAARMLELAAASADQLVAEAKAEAASLLAHARAETERESAELDRHRTVVMAELADEQTALEAKITALRQQEREHRAYLRRHFADQLAQLEDAVPAAPLAAVAD
jgi:DivIVA domain-containing protein